jgi:anhydro-N-acetylmuramic acid kinase
MLGRQLGGEVSFHNLGGISNLSYISLRGEVLAFDTGPANLWIDESVVLHTQGRLRYDRGGKLAIQGRPDATAVKKLLRHWFLLKTPPKSTGRDDFPFNTLLKTTRARGVDLIATATEFTATSIAHAYRRSILRKGRSLRAIYFCGGGAKNQTLLARIAELLPNTHVCTVDALGLKPEAIEAQGFAYFGSLVLQGRSLSGTWTGASLNAHSGSITPGENWPRLLRNLAQLKA